MSERNRIEILLRDQDRDRIEMIQGIWGLSISDVVRMGIIALSKQMGYEKDMPNDFLKEK